MLGRKRMLSNQVGGCSPWRRTRERWVVRLGPPGSLRKAKEQRRERNIPPHAVRAIALALMNAIMQREAVGRQGNCMGLQRLHLLRPRCDIPAKDDVEPMEVDPPNYSVGPLAVQPPQDSEEPMEVDPPDYGVGPLAVQPVQDTEEPMEVDTPQEPSSMALAPPATGIVW
ncbi:hypothetical protein AV530_010967 [Patagioenas fasciata monilis]|uniref:Uncharacterized protein n=1 Tax=Patagioenas fasciata monilis TaxID=372326 RepID=A0A1V4K8E4_PATFA|nr:hypothetical protein AV530_010967 [Patagioenas fasciata monilis]